MTERISFEEAEVKAYIDRSIAHWRRMRDDEYYGAAVYYIDALQELREALFGEMLLPEEME